MQLRRDSLLGVAPQPQLHGRRAGLERLPPHLGTQPRLLRTQLMAAHSQRAERARQEAQAAMQPEQLRLRVG